MDRVKMLTVVTPPVAKARARTTMRAGNVRSYTPRKTEEAEWRIRTEWIARHGSTPQFGPLALDVLAYVAMPKSMPKSRRDTALPTTRPDADNYLKTVADGLNGIAFSDDAQLVDMRVQKRYAIDSPPRWEITLTEALP